MLSRGPGSGGFRGCLNSDTSSSDVCVRSREGLNTYPGQRLEAVIGLTIQCCKFFLMLLNVKQGLLRTSGVSTWHNSQALQQTLRFHGESPLIFPVRLFCGLETASQNLQKTHLLRWWLPAHTALCAEHFPAVAMNPHGQHLLSAALAGLPPYSAPAALPREGPCSPGSVPPPPGLTDRGLTACKQLHSKGRHAFVPCNNIGGLWNSVSTQ